MDHRIFAKISGDFHLDASDTVRANAIFHFRVGGHTMPAEVTDNSVSIEIPRGLEVGVYDVTMSVDGGMVFTSSSLTFEILRCPAGSTCQDTTVTPCPLGYFCPQEGTLRTLKCPIGFFASSEEQARCTRCTSGRHCPWLGMPYTRFCPSGYICDVTASGSLN